MNLKQKLSRKLKKTGGFTLIEMLIVVAIIAILVVVSIPMVTSSLEDARVAADQANERAAKGAAMIQYLSDGETGDATYLYDAADGTVAKSGGDAPTGYGQCSAHKDAYVSVIITAADPDTGTDTTVAVEWVGSGTGFNKNPHNSDGSIS